MKTVSRVLFAVALVLLPGCKSLPGYRVTRVLDDVETYINDRPDSALAVLRGLDSTVVRGRALRARYSLLHTMALDKCYEDITVPGLLEDATAWFSRHGSPDDRMKTCYYQGRIFQDQGDLSQAAIAYSRAESYAAQAKDSHAKGLLFLSFGSVYNMVYNTQQELHYKSEGVRILEKAGDPLYDAALGELALTYHSMQEWAMADSLYRKGLENASANNYAMRVLLSNYAKMLVLQPEPNPAEAICLLKRLQTEFGASLSVMDASVYAYAADLLGDTKTADAIVRQLENLPDSRKTVAQAMLARIVLHRNDYENAFDHLQEAYNEQTKKVRVMLEDSISKALQEHYEVQADLERKEKMVVLLLLAGAVLLLLIVILLIKIRKTATERERDRLYEIRASLMREMHDLESRYDALSKEYSKTNEELQQEKEDLCRLEAIKEEFQRERLERFRQMGRFGSTIWQRENKRIEESLAWKEMKEQVNYLYQMQQGGTELVRRLDSALDGAISRLRRDLKLRGKPKEVLFLCCCILDMDPIVISDVLDLSVDNVYTKKSRYRSKVEALGKTEYIILLGKREPKIL